MAVPVILGFSGELAQPLYVDVQTTPRVLFVAGRSGSGKTTALMTIAELLLTRGVKVTALSPAGTALAAVGGRDRMTTVLTGVDAINFSSDFLGDGVGAVVIDDAEHIDWQGGDRLKLLDGHAAPVIAAVAADALTGATAPWVAALKRNRTGVLLSPRSKFDGAVFGGTLSDQMIFDGPPGRGIAGIGGRVDIVQMPVPDPS
jgi:S-DNA-T family DNA segregation ATPase FtsK/SpoIIIE